MQESNSLSGSTGLGASDRQLLEAVDTLLETSPCDCSHARRYERGEHLSGCYLFDLNIARKVMVAGPRFQMTYCSQCGKELGPGNEGVSRCSDHQAKWKFVPVEPTPEMVKAWANAAPHESDRSWTDEEANRRWATADWQAMLAAAPVFDAAPDLLRVAELLVDWLDEEPGAHKLCDMARAAIAKATGAQS